MNARRWIEIVVLFVIACVWLNWHILRNLAISLVGIIYFPIYLIKSGNWRIFVPVVALGVLMIVVAVVHDLWKGIRQR